MKQLFKSDFTSREYNQVLIIALALLLSMVFSLKSYAEELEVKVLLVDVTVNGTVTDENGEPIPGAAVSLKSQQGVGTVTDASGSYSLDVPEGSTLVFSFVGMATKEIAVGNSTTINVVLETDVQSLQEVVVVGYGTQKKSDITGAVGVVDTDQFKDEPIVQVGQALQGKVAGVQVSQNSGAPGSGLLIRVRGAGTVNNADPLYVVDGNPNVDPIDLVPEQIESIQVLKSASAAAIYGAQGANGVVLITTKQGKPGKSSLNINFAQGWQQLWNHLPVTNAEQYATLYNEGLVNAGDAPLYPNPSALGEGTDWQDVMFDVAPMTTVSVSASGGSASSRFFFSGGYTNQDGIMPQSGFERVNLRINSSHNINDAIEVGQNFSGSFSNTRNIQEFYFASILGRTLQANPEIVPLNPDGSYGFSETSLNSANPLAQVNQNISDNRRAILNGNVYANITFLEDFNFRSQYNFNLGFIQPTTFVPAYFIAVGQENPNSTLREGNRRLEEWSWANTLTYDKEFGGHTLSILAGYTMQESKTRYVEAYGEGLPANAADDPNLRFLDLSTSTAQISGDGGEWGILSYLGRINYDFRGKYFATVNFRADGSSRFGANNKWGYFPSFSLGWKLSEESFLNYSWLNNLMLRAGWGSLGNQNALPNYAFAGLVTPNRNYTFGDPQTVVRGQAPTGAGNPNLKWESTEETNLGLDFMAVNGTITASIDWYRKVTTDMILQVPLVAYSGIQSFPYVNGGSVLNTGIEILLGYENTTGNGITYGITANVARNRNEVLELSNDGADIFYELSSFIGDANVTRVGEPIASFWGWQMDGIFQTQEDVDNHATQTEGGTAPGDIRFANLDTTPNEEGEQVINADDRTIIGNPWPQFVYGLTGSLAYKNFDFRLQLQGVHGNDIYMGLRHRLEGSNFFNYSQRVWDERWTGPGTSNTVPRVNTNDPNNNMRSSSYYLEDGSYLRVRNVQLTYKIPSNLFNDLFTLSVYGSIQNALTFTKYPGFDPEIGSNGNNPRYVGFDEANYPVPRIYTIGFKFGL